MELWGDSLNVLIQMPGLTRDELRGFKKGFKRYSYMESDTPVPIAFWVFSFPSPHGPAECNFNARIVRSEYIESFLDTSEGVKNAVQFYLLDGDIPVLSEAYFILRHLGFRSLPPMIVVGVKNTDRNRDMIPGTKSEGAQKFMRFFSEELIPHIENKYSVENFRIIYGASNAGLFVLHSLLTDPAIFSAHIASSPTIIWSKEYMAEKLSAAAKDSSELKNFLYVIYADNDWTKVRDTLKEYLPALEPLRERGLRLETRYVPEEGHVPLNSLYHGLLALFDGYSYPDEKRRHEGLDSLIAYYRNYSERIGYRVQVPFSALNGAGQSLLFRQKKIKEAIEVFELMKRHYPNEGSCDMMLAVSYYKDNNLKKSREYFLRASANKELEIPPFPEWAEMKKIFKTPK